MRPAVALSMSANRCCCWCCCCWLELLLWLMRLSSKRGTGLRHYMSVV